MMTTVPCPLDNCGRPLSLHFFEDMSVGIGSTLEEFSGCRHAPELNDLLEDATDDDEFRAHPRIAPVYAAVERQHAEEAQVEYEESLKIEAAAREWENQPLPDEEESKKIL